MSWVAQWTKCPLAAHLGLATTRQTGPVSTVVSLVVILFMAKQQGCGWQWMCLATDVAGDDVGDDIGDLTDGQEDLQWCWVMECGISLLVMEEQEWSVDW